MKEFDKKTIVDFIEDQNPVYGFCGDVFFTNLNIMKNVIDEFGFDYYLEFLKSNEDSDEYTVADYYDEKLNSVICFDTDVYTEFSNAEDMYSYLLSLQMKKEKIENKIGLLYQ